MKAEKKFKENLSYDNLSDSEWLGEVVDNNDDLKEGRCKIRVFGKFDLLDIAAIPWAYPSNSNSFAGGSSKGSGNLAVPKIGTRVKVKFSGGNLYSPEYLAVQNINDNLKTLISDSYLNSTVLYFDEDEKTHIVYTPSIGIQIFKNGSNITINPDDSITIEHKDTKSIIELTGPTINITANSTVNVTSNTDINIESSNCSLNGSDVTKLGPAPGYSAVLAEPLFALLKIMATTIDTKYPSTPTVTQTLVEQFEKLATSTNVKVSK